MTYQPRTIKLDTPVRLQLAINALTNAPLDQNLEMVIREHKKNRTNQQNNLYWAEMADIAEQVWLEGKQYSAEIYHHYLKQLFLPDETEPYLPAHVKNTSYRKWEYSPSGERVLIGSTTDLTTYGFTEYMTKVQAWGANHGVLFTTKEQR